MGPITKVIPVARLVPLGGPAGQLYRVGEARLLDLAKIQGWLDAQWEDPLEPIRDRVYALDRNSEERRKLLTTAWEVAKAGPPVEGEASGERILASDLGAIQVLWVALNRHQKVDEPTCLELWQTSTEDQITRLRRVFYGADPLAEIERLLMVAPPRPTGGRRTTWGEAIDSLALSHHWTYRYIYSLTLSEFANAKTGGKPAPQGQPISDADMERAVREQFKAFHGHYPDESPLPQGAPDGVGGHPQGADAAVAIDEPDL